MEAGDGPPLLLLHQTASSAFMFLRTLPFIAERHRAIALDTPGFGLSDPPARRGEMGEYASAAIAVLDHLGIDRAAAVGFHTGASIALELAANHADRTSAAIIAGILAVATDEERSTWEEMIVKPWEPDGRGEFVAGIREFLQMYVPEDDGEVFLAELIGRLLAGPNYHWAYEAIFNQPAFELAPTIGVPMLVLNPADDAIYAETKRFSSAAPQARYEEMPGGAEAITSHPREFAQVVLDFLSTID